MRTLVVLTAALLTTACTGSSAAPSRTYQAALTATAPIVGVCQDVRCTFSATITNNGPDCATGVGLALSVTEAPLFPLLGVGAAYVGVLRPNQVVTVNGTDWPRNGVLVTAATASGQPIACP